MSRVAQPEDELPFGSVWWEEAAPAGIPREAGAVVCAKKVVARGEAVDKGGGATEGIKEPGARSDGHPEAHATAVCASRVRCAESTHTRAARYRRTQRPCVREACVYMYVA